MDGVYYNMTNLSQFLGGGFGQDEDSRKEGAPLFVMYGGDFNTNWDAIVRDTTALNTVGSPWAAITSSTASYAHGMSASTQAFGYQGDVGSLSTQLSTEAFGNFSSWTQSLFQNNQYPFFVYGSCSPQGRISWLNGNSQMDSALAHAHLIDVTNMPEGCRPRRNYSVYDNAFTWRASNHGGSGNGISGHSAIDNISLASYVTKVNGFTLSRTMATYNETTKTLVVLWGSSGSTTVDCAVFKGTVNLNKVAKLEDYFSTASVKNFSITGSAPAALNSINYSNSMHIDNNDRLLMHWSYSSSSSLYAVSLAGSAGTVAATAVASRNQTTSYGPETSFAYRPKVQTTWDHKWIAMTRPYYYYGSGHQTWFVSAEDNTRYFYANYTASSGGGAIFPSGRTGFTYFTGVNGDSAGLQGMTWNFERTSTTGTSNTFYLPSRAGSITTLGLVSIVNGGALAVDTYNLGTLPSYWYSTSYPRFATVNYWPKENNVIAGDMFSSLYEG